MKKVKIQLSECSTQNPSESRKKNINRIEKENSKKDDTKDDTEDKNK